MIKGLVLHLNTRLCPCHESNIKFDIQEYCRGVFRIKRFKYIWIECSVCDKQAFAPLDDVPIIVRPKSDFYFPDFIPSKVGEEDTVKVRIKISGISSERQRDSAKVLKFIPRKSKETKDD